MITLLRPAGLAFAATVLVVTGCEKADRTDISTIITRHTEARGGAAALEAVNAIEVTRRVEEDNRQFTTHYIATRDGRMRLDVRDDRRLVFSAGNDGQSFWQKRGSLAPAEEMPEWALAAVRRAVRYNLYGLHELAASGTTLTLADREKSAGLLHWVIDATDADGYRRRLFIDPHSFLITRVQEHAAVNPDRSNYTTDLDSYYSDFRRVEGVLFSFESETHTSESGQAAQKTTASEIVVNPTFDPATFARPAERRPQPPE